MARNSLVEVVDYREDAWEVPNSFLDLDSAIIHEFHGDSAVSDFVAARCGKIVRWSLLAPSSPTRGHLLTISIENRTSDEVTLSPDLATATDQVAGVLEQRWPGILTRALTDDLAVVDDPPRRVGLPQFAYLPSGQLE
jgi:hypothetical protein